MPAILPQQRDYAMLFLYLIAFGVPVNLIGGDTGSGPSFFRQRWF